MTGAFQKDVNGEHFEVCVRHCKDSSEYAHVLVSKLAPDGMAEWTARVNLVGLWPASRGEFQSRMPAADEPPEPGLKEEQEKAERVVTLFYNKCRKMWVKEHRGNVLEHRFHHEDKSAPNYRGMLSGTRLPARLADRDGRRLGDVE